MAPETSPAEQALARALRDTLESLRRTANEFEHAMTDLVSACSSNRPLNALSPLLRAQTSAASLTAALNVLGNYIAGAANTAPAGVAEMISRAVTIPAPTAVPVAPPPVSIPTPMAAASPAAVEVAPPPPPPPMAAPVVEPPPPPPPPEPVVEAPPVVEAVPPPPPEPAPVPVVEAAPPPPPPVVEAEPVPVVAAAPARMEIPPEVMAFDIATLPPDQQEVHRRANRAAKVSMQDIKLLKPKDVAAGRENRDLCSRLREDIDKARKEYDRRFKAILDQPVDYFYQWMVDILAEGKPELLGDYPYPSPMLRR